MVAVPLTSPERRDLYDVLRLYVRTGPGSTCWGLMEQLRANTDRRRPVLITFTSRQVHAATVSLRAHAKMNAAPRFERLAGKIER